MGVLYPSTAVARRWNGALEARLRRAPLEAFLRGQRLATAAPGASRDTDNLARGTSCIVDAGIALYFNDDSSLAFNQRPVVAHATCLVSLALAQQIGEPDLWRNAALMSSAKLLSRWIGLHSAAIVSAMVARTFQKEIAIGLSPSDWRISKCAAEAVSCNDSNSLARAASSIAARLDAEPPMALAAVRDCESQPG
jgi:hypothetical protein